MNETGATVRVGGVTVLLHDAADAVTQYLDVRRNTTGVTPYVSHVRLLDIVAWHGGGQQAT